MAVNVERDADGRVAQALTHNLGVYTKCAIACFAFFVFAYPAFSIMASAEIQPYSANPRYWEYRGEPVLLLGGSNRAELFQWTGSQLQNHLDTLQSAGGNYVRNDVWSKRYFSPEGDNDIYPFEKVGSTYDLNQWNAEFWTRLDNFYQETQQRGIIVQTELWDAFSFRSPGWDISPWNPKNNSNYTSSESGLPTSWDIHPSQGDSPFVLTVPGLSNSSKGGAVVLPYQEKFVQKILDVGRPYDHIIYQIHN